MAPWYRWPVPAGGTRREGRGTRPAIQKYADSKLVDAFQADPQRSLRYVDDDYVHELVAVTDTVPSGPMQGKRRFLAVNRPVRTDTRKLFQAVHKRFYLVVCQLHCDAPGFPRADREGVCEAGMVVRRRFLSYDHADEEEAASILRRIAALQVELAAIDSPDRRERRRRLLRRRARNGSSASSAEHRAELLDEAATARVELVEWASDSGASWFHEGWIPSGTEGIGSWQPVEEAPAQIVEQVTPMFPLVPHPEETDNAGRHGAIYFGLLPTAGVEADRFGEARFDDEALYDVRCFVRRHRPECPRTGEPNDCNGELFWSAPTEAYRLAPHFDLDGSANRPLTIKMPDLKMLAAQALSKPMGSLSPVKVISPAGSMPTEAGINLGQIVCFWSIPLITIVAYFLLNLFLPIVVVLFGLFWMLMLKFCSLPPFAIDAALSLQLSAHAGLDLDLDIGVQVEADALHAALLANLDAQFPKQEDDDRAASSFVADVGNQALADFQTQLANPPAQGPDFAAGLEWEERVEFEEEVAFA